MTGWTPVVLVVLAGCLACVALILAATRIFAFLDRVVDRWRPTAEHQARPGHDNLAVGALCVALPIAAFAWYDVGSLVAQTLRDPQFMPIVSMVVTLVVTPTVGIVCLFRWKNARITFLAPSIQTTDWLGRESPWERIKSVTKTPSFRPPGRVGFEVEPGWIIADTNWINVRSIYEEAAEVGVSADPWTESGRSKAATNK